MLNKPIKQPSPLNEKVFRFDMPSQQSDMRYVVGSILSPSSLTMTRPQASADDDTGTAFLERLSLKRGTIEKKERIFSNDDERE